MKPISPKTLLSLSSSSSSSFSLSPYSILVSHFSTSALSHPLRRHEEGSRNVRVSVWWDFENCNLPVGVNVFKVAHSITAAIRASGIKGPLTITAFGDVVQLSRTNQEALSSTGINIAHVPRGGKNSADRSLLVDLMYWVSQNPPPAHLFLISGDRDFASILHRLRMNNYNILLASPETAPNVLCSAASIMWHWNSLVRGEKLIGRHFNQPPDGPYGSWYGHYKVPLEDPFLFTERSACSRIGEVAEITSECKIRPVPVAEIASESKIRPVPKSVLRQIRQILNSYPKGISITDLRAELNNSTVSIDKDLYGYGKFSRFLLSMRHILELQSKGDGQFLVLGVTQKAPEPFESSPGTCRNVEQDLSKSLKLNGEERHKNGAVDSKSTLMLSTEVNVEKPPRKVQQAPAVSDKVASMDLLSPEVNVEKPPRKVQQAPALSDKVADMDPQEPSKEVQKPPPTDKELVEPVSAQEDAGHPPSVIEQQDSATQVGFFKKNWQRWFGGKDSQMKSLNIQQKCIVSGDNSEKISHSTPKKLCISGDSLDEKKVEKCMRSPSPDADPVHLASLSSSSDKSGHESKVATSAEPRIDKAATSSGFIHRILIRCKFWSSSSDPVTLDDQTSEKLNQVDNNSQMHQEFSKDSFWCDMESFLDSARGSDIVSQSRTREQMAQSLQKEGPLILRDLSEGDMLNLVNLLISEKKWVEECPSQIPPFKYTRSVGTKSSLGHPVAANRLSSIFLVTAAKSNKQKVTERDEERNVQNISHAGVSGHKPSDRSRNDVLADCQKLVSEILEKYPEGYNLGSLRKLFLETYDYHLDVRKLGYQKLASLIQVMPGVKIESTYIVPSSNVPRGSDLGIFSPDIQEDNSCHPLSNSDSELSETSKKSDDSDSTWDELGPISDIRLDRKEVQPVPSSKAVEETKRQPYPDYEPSVSDDEFSDSEEETSTVTRAGRQGKLGINEEESSLLQILDSWYSSKENEDSKGKSENVNGMVDCSTNVVEPSASPELSSKSATLLENFGKKSRPQKNYDFVSDTVENNKDKLIDGILGSLKKSGESRVCKAEG
ncbi:hypothetical protein LWI28_017106 [Acer negundo]|uniref:HTH OST-type domain-containing protein n=1 Tax=Acer negundo TaxID=4023 RepID=A0AAD5IIK4_ACENE|nr:hypothetical protein LWI28_017106 [Acer negundo]KAK4840678.1 hypothetical protein QYF36_015508 [Acer negundo]